MANPSPKHKFSSSNQPPPRGKSYRTVLLEALRAANTPMNEIEFVTYYINKAMTCEDAQATGMLREIFLRLNPIPKPVAPPVEFDFPADGTPVQKIEGEYIYTEYSSEIRQQSWLSKNGNTDMYLSVIM